MGCSMSRSVWENTLNICIQCWWLKVEDQPLTNRCRNTKFGLHDLLLVNGCQSISMLRNVGLYAPQTGLGQNAYSLLAVQHSNLFKYVRQRPQPQTMVNLSNIIFFRWLVVSSPFLSIFALERQPLLSHLSAPVQKRGRACPALPAGWWSVLFPQWIVTNQNKPQWNHIKSRITNSPRILRRWFNLKWPNICLPS